MTDMAKQAEIFEQVVRARRSIRGFLPKPIAPDLLEKIFTIAGQAPSNCNCQPWIVHVVSGATRDTLRARLVQAALEEKPQSDIPLTDHYINEYKERRIGAAVALFEATGVGRHDAAARQASFLRNFELFDAPHAALIFMPRYFGLREASDCGMYMQTLMLTLTAFGLGSCAQGALSHYMQAVHEILPIPEDLICLYGLSFGYPDYQHPSDAARTTRAPLSDLVTFHT